MFLLISVVLFATVNVKGYKANVDSTGPDTEVLRVDNAAGNGRIHFLCECKFTLLNCYEYKDCHCNCNLQFLKGIMNGQVYSGSHFSLPVLYFALLVQLFMQQLDIFLNRATSSTLLKPCRRLIVE